MFCALLASAPGSNCISPTHPLDMPLFITAELSGKTDLERAREDMIVDCLDDAISPFLHPGHVMNPDVQARVCCSQQQIQCGLEMCMGIGTQMCQKMGMRIMEEYT